MKCFLYPDIGRVDEPLQLHMDGLEPHEMVTITMSMDQSDSGRWTSTITTKADDNGKLLISNHNKEKTNEFTELIWNLRPTDQASEAYLKLEQLQSLTFYIDLQASISGRKESRTVTRLFKEDYVTEVLISSKNIDGTYYYPKNKTNLTSIIVLGGSDGKVPKETAALLASHGYGALALRYFGQRKKPESLIHVPMEQINQAVDWLTNHPSTDGEKIVIFGREKGSELALLAASRSKKIKGVIANSPASHVFQSIDSNKRASSWSENGKAIPFVPFSYSLPMLFKKWKSGFIKGEFNLSTIYERSLRKYDQKGKTDAIIPVEKIQGPILLLSGEQDGVWPSEVMAKQIVERLKRHSFSYEIKHLPFAHTGQLLIPPYLPASPSDNNEDSLGGSAYNNAASGESAWIETLEFLKKHFPPASIPTETIAFQTIG